MKNIKSGIVAALLLGGFWEKADAQIEFKIQRLTNSDYYTVSAVPQQDYPAPKNMISTAQVTITVPTGGFEVAEVRSLYANARWRVNGRCNAPHEGTNCDYIYFGLENMGTTAYPLRKGQETLLFTFRAGGHCTGEVSLMDNQGDGFRSPNSMRVNVGNQITVLGAGGDAYVGNRDGGKATCFEDALAGKAEGEINIFPNPVNDKPFSFAFNNKSTTATEGSVWLYDMAGRAVFFKTYHFEPGVNEQEVSLATFPIGVYQLAVNIKDKEPMYATVVKGDY